MDPAFNPIIEHGSILSNSSFIYYYYWLIYKDPSINIGSNIKD